MNNRLIIHPFLLTAYPLLFLFLQNSDQLVVKEVYASLAISVGGALLLFLSLGLVLKNFVKAGIITTIFAVFFFSYGHAFSVIEDWLPIKSAMAKHIFLELVWIAALVFSIIKIAKTQRDLTKTTGFLNIIGLVLVLFTLTSIITYEIKNKNIRQNRDSSATVAEISEKPREPSIKYRDIYYIILDGYAHNSVLREFYNYDNNDFTDFLVGNGFYVASESCSNYGMTYLSLMSSLNMEYVNYLSDKPGAASRDRVIPNSMIRSNRVSQFLKSRNYKIVHFDSGWGPTRNSRYADILIKHGLGDSFAAILSQTTMLNPLQKSIFGTGARERIVGNFDDMAKIPEIPGPKFVFSHVVAPHPPYLFDADGNKVPQSKFKMHGMVWTERDKYINQLIFINKQVKYVVAQLLSKSELEPIIIIQADHGPASTFYEPGSGGWNHPTARKLRERMRILNAYYFPAQLQQFLYPSISPVNTFRLIFQRYFNGDYEMLEDRSYYSTYQLPYQFTDVTEQLSVD